MENTDRVSLLKHFHLTQRDELGYRRRREHQVFSWTAASFVALAGGILFRLPTVVESTIEQRVMLSVFVLLFCWFSVGWQLHHRRKGARNRTVIKNIGLELGAHEQPSTLRLRDKVPLFPEEFLRDGEKNNTFRELIMLKTKVAATVWLGAFVLFAVWIG